MPEPYQIRYAENAAADIRAMRKFDQRKVLDGIETHLLHQPKRESKTRIKAMRQPFWSQFRLRVDDCRVYYDVDDEALLVTVLRALGKTTETTQGEST